MSPHSSNEDPLDHLRLVGADPASQDHASDPPSPHGQELAALRAERSHLQRRVDRLAPKLTELEHALADSQHALHEVSASHAAISARLEEITRTEREGRDALTRSEGERERLERELREALQGGISLCRKALHALGHGVRERSLSHLSNEELHAMFSVLHEDLLAYVIDAAERHAAREEKLVALRAQMEARHSKPPAAEVELLAGEISQIVTTLPALPTEERERLGREIVIHPRGPEIFSRLAMRLREAAFEAVEREDEAASDMMLDTLAAVADLVSRGVEHRSATHFILGVELQEASYLVDRASEGTLRVLLGCYLADRTHAHIRLSPKFRDLVASLSPQARALLVEESTKPTEQLEALFALPHLRKAVRTPFREDSPTWRECLQAFQRTVAALAPQTWPSLRERFFRDSEPSPDTLNVLGLTSAGYVQLYTALASLEESR